MCSSEPVFSDKSAAEAKASSASLEPSVARRILVGKMLIGSPHIFGSSHLVGMMSVGEPCCFRNPYSPKCVEDEFSEVRGSNLRWHGLGPIAPKRLEAESLPHLQCGSYNRIADPRRAVTTC